MAFIIYLQMLVSDPIPSPTMSRLNQTFGTNAMDIYQQHLCNGWLFLFLKFPIVPINIAMHALWLNKPD